MLGHRISGIMSAAAKAVELAINEESQFVQILSEVLLPAKRIHLTGVGKSGMLADRAAATWRSYGHDATYEHATDLLHGGIGGLWGDALIVVTHSGRTAECVEMVRKNGPWQLIVISGDWFSPAVGEAEYRLVYRLDESVDMTVHGLPLGTNYVQAGILDALGLELFEELRPSRSTIKTWHPGGSYE